MVNRFAQFTGAISAIYRDIQKIERDEMEKYGLKGAFAQYLLVMDRHPDGITAASLCEECDKDKAAVSRILSEMEGKGLVCRQIGEGPYRAKLFLTESGKDAARFVCQKAVAAVELAGEGLTDPDRKIFYTALALIAGNLQAICREGIPE
mgnify:CR=1 FL=1